MARKPGNLNPDSTAGNARLGTGRGSNAGRAQIDPARSKTLADQFAAQFKQFQATRPIRGHAISDYWKTINKSGGGR